MRDLTRVGCTTKFMLTMDLKQKKKNISRILHLLKADKILQEEGSLTHSAKKVFLANVQVKILDAEPGCLKMNLFLIPFSIILHIPLPLVGRVFLRETRSHTVRTKSRYTTVDAVGWCR
jgi:hypothetical protein